MRDSSKNPTWLMWYEPFKVLAVSGGYLTAFFLLHGMSWWQIFLLQSVFTFTAAVWEIPSGMIADKIGLARSIKISTPIAVTSIVAYGFSTNFGQFAACEFVLAIGNGLLSGVDKALLYDSLKAMGLTGDTLRQRYTRLDRRIKAFGYLATLPGAGIAWLLLNRLHLGLGSTIVADGLLTAVGAALFVGRLAEVRNGGQEEARKEAWRELKLLMANRQARWLVALGATLSTATYVAFWLSVPYYNSIGIPIAWFGFALGVRNAWKGAWALCYSRPRKKRRRPARLHDGHALTAFAVIVGVTYLGMATGTIWLVWVVLGHDVVQALQEQPIMARLNHFIPDEHRAALNSAVNLSNRLSYSVIGPLAGLLVTLVGLQTTFVVLGLSCSNLALLAIWRLRRLGTFQ